MSSDTDWLLYLGAPGYSFPSYSPTLPSNLLTIKENKSTFISFKAEQYVTLPRRGYFDPIEHCKEGISVPDTIACSKKCFVEKQKVKVSLWFLGSVCVCVCVCVSVCV